MKSLTKAQNQLAERMIAKEDLVLVCKHVLAKTSNAEYHKSDDSYVCSKCRDRHGITCNKLVGQVCKCVPYLSMVHRSCLGI